MILRRAAGGRAYINSQRAIGTRLYSLVPPFPRQCAVKGKKRKLERPERSGPNGWDDFLLPLTYVRLLGNPKKPHSSA